MILIFGSNGLLGSTFKVFLKKKGIDFRSISYTNGDIKGNIFDKNFLKKKFLKEKPKIIVNFSAVTNVDYCENNFKEANKINSLLPLKISEALEEIKKDIYLIHISTDQVYTGKGPHKENENIYPINVYSKTKFEGEKNIKYKNAIILRTNFFGKSIVNHRKSFSDWIFENISNKNEIKLFSDVFFSPLSFNTFFEILMKIISAKPLGTYNLGSNNGMSKKKFAICFARLFKNLELKYKVLSIKNFPLIAKRPNDMRLDNKKIENILKIKIKSLDEEIKKVSREYS